MRQLIVLLLLANFAFLAWTQWIVGPQRQAGTRTATAPRLTLAGEAGAGPSAAAVPQVGDSGCVSLGPFLDLTEAARASTGLRETGFEPRQRATEGAVWSGYWVSLAVDDAAEQAVERLRAGGVGDAYLMPAEGAEPIISLGLFTDRARALRRVDEVRALGFQPEVTERQRPGTVYWIDIDLAPGGLLPDPTAFESDSGRIFRLELQPCDEAGRNSQPLAPASLPDGVPG